jgi:hypothetical protein
MRFLSECGEDCLRKGSLPCPLWYGQTAMTLVRRFDVRPLYYVIFSLYSDMDLKGS